ncbi:MAG: hypothetical protein ACI35P_07475 [Bacillus sp. (in: firmicutes)]
MSGIKVDEEIQKIERAPLNTTINKTVFDKFKANCKSAGIPMNILIEAFMRQYNEGGFYLKFGREQEFDSVSSDEGNNG